jgi:hypothetical protein
VISNFQQHWQIDWFWLALHRILIITQAYRLVQRLYIIIGDLERDETHGFREKCMREKEWQHKYTD